MPTYIDIHTHHPEPETLTLLNVRIDGPRPVLPRHGFFSAGIHPWDTLNAIPAWLDIFSDPPPGLIAVGETGLDYRPEYKPYDRQKEWLEKQIEIANNIRKPLIIHNVHASDDTLRLLKTHATVPAILHGFTGTAELAGQCLRQYTGLRLSFGPTALQSPKTQLAFRHVVTSYPDRFFLETDDNPRTTIREMYRFASELMQWDITRLQDRINHNFNILFPQISL